MVGISPHKCQGWRSSLVLSRGCLCVLSRLQSFSASIVPIPYLIALCALRLLASKPKEGRDRAQRQAEGREGQTRQGSKQRRKERSEWRPLRLNERQAQLCILSRKQGIPPIRLRENSFPYSLRASFRYQLTSLVVTRSHSVNKTSRQSRGQLPCSVSAEKVEKDSDTIALT